ncbi:nucleoside-specific channel-forming protein [Citrobacter koseri]|nr:nucleoside-specific channel-forming protein [Citrobacter koseri]
MTNRNTFQTGGTRAFNVVGSYHTRFGPQLRNDTYLEYEAFAKKDWFDFYGYMDAPVFFGGNTNAKGIWNHGSPLFMEIEPRFSIDKLTGADLSFGRSKSGISLTTTSMTWVVTSLAVRAPGTWVWVLTSKPVCR